MANNANFSAGQYFRAPPRSCECGYKRKKRGSKNSEPSTTKGTTIIYVATKQ